MDMVWIHVSLNIACLVFWIFAIILGFAKHNRGGILFYPATWWQ